MSSNVFTVAAAGPRKINVYDAMTGGIFKMVNLSGNAEIVSSPIVFGDGFSVAVKEGGSTYSYIYGLPLCNLKSKTHIS